MPERRMEVELEFNEEVLGTAPANVDVFKDYVATNNPDGVDADEVAAIAKAGEDVEEEEKERGRTIFARDEDGKPFLYDYVIKGFFKDACGMLRRVSDTESAKLTSYKKVIDGLVFPEPRKIHLVLPKGGELGR